MLDVDIPESLPTVVLGALVFLCGLFLRLRSQWQIRAASGWKSVTGTIVHASIEHEWTKQSRFYRGIVAYTYRVGGMDMTGGRICLIEDGRRGLSKDAEKDLLRFPPGALVQVHYDPAMPGRSCLVVDGPWQGALYVMALGLAFAVLGPYVAGVY